jgi:hypothetical protein
MQSHSHHKITKWRRERDASNCQYHNTELGPYTDWLHIFHIYLDLNVIDWYTKTCPCAQHQSDKTATTRHVFPGLAQKSQGRHSLPRSSRPRGSFGITNASSQWTIPNSCTPSVPLPPPTLLAGTTGKNGRVAGDGHHVGIHATYRIM